MDPSSSTRGGTVILTGVGFSVVPEENVILLGSVSVSASAYGVTNDGKETLTFSIPNDVSAGQTSLIVTVEGEVSNSVNITVLP